MKGTKILNTDRIIDSYDFDDLATPSESVNFDSKKPRVAVIKKLNLNLNMVKRKRRINKVDVDWRKMVKS